MKTTELDVLLQKSLNRELPLPTKVEAETWRRMNAIPQKKGEFFSTFLKIAAVVIFVLETIIIFPFISNTILKITFLYIFFCVICVVVCHAILTKNIILKHIL
jgi:uncharacterized membrane protein